MMSANEDREKARQQQAGDTVAAFAKGLAESSPPKGVDMIRAAAHAGENAEAQQRKEARDALIRDRAYFLWVESGRPEGKHEEFWLKAEAEFVK